MLEYLLNNEALHIDDDASVTIVNYNPACYTDSIMNCAALDVGIPVNERNRALLGSPERFERDSDSSTREFPGFEIRYNGVLIMAGTLNIDEATSESYSGWVQSSLGALAEELEDTYLNELDWPTEQSFNEKDDYDDDTDDYNIQSIENKLFWDGKGSEETVDVEYTDENGETQTTSETQYVFTKHFGDNYDYIVNSFDSSDIKTCCVISPFLHLRYVIRESLRLNGFYIDRNDMVDDENSNMKDVMVYNNYNIVDMVTTSEGLTLYDYDHESASYEEVIANTISIGEWFIGTFNYADLLPEVLYKDFLLGLQNSINYIFHFRNDNYVNIIDRNQILNRTAIDIDDYFRGSWEMGEVQDLRLKFTAEYDENDAQFSENYEDLSDRWDDFGDNVESYEDLEDIENPEFGELRLVEDVNKIYEYGYTTETVEDVNSVEEQFDIIDWFFVSNGPQPYIYGDSDDEEEITTSVSTLQRDYPDDLDYDPYRLVVEQEGNMNKLRNLWSDFSLRLFSNGFFTRGQLMCWHGDLGLFQQHWKTWADFWMARQEIVGYFQLPLNMFSHMQNNITEPYRTRKGRFIIEETSTTFKMHSIGETTINGYKI